MNGHEFFKIFFVKNLRIREFERSTFGSFACKEFERSTFVALLAKNFSFRLEFLGI
jgi:hypothetical protein